jgi:hypothetical protein
LRTVELASLCVTTKVRDKRKKTLAEAEADNIGEKEKKTTNETISKWKEKKRNSPFNMTFLSLSISCSLLNISW